jgi:hypothetical protein
MKLYIIGNGFDIHHGIKSKYSNFKDYVEINDKDLFETLEKYFNTDELWSDFEETLADIDTATIIDDASNLLVSYASDEWSESNNFDYQDEINDAIEIVTVQLKKQFINWILDLQIPNSEKVILDKKSKYLTFNYTKTLEQTYGIDSNNILYIHNKAIDVNSLLILGHSRKPKHEESFSKSDDEDTDVRVAEGNAILDKYFNDTYKNSETIIKENIGFFSQVDKVSNIYVLGHSISPCDIRYFEEIKQKVRSDVIWTLSYRDKYKKNAIRNKIIGLGVDKSKIKMIRLNELHKCFAIRLAYKFCSLF